MSRTYRIKNVQDLIPWRIAYHKEWHPEKSKRYMDSLFHRDGRAVWWLMTTPSHWNREFNTKPRRAKTRNLIKQIYTLEDYEDAPEFPLDKKPHIYYW